jgi:hypothetical protein
MEGVGMDPKKEKKYRNYPVSPYCRRSSTAGCTRTKHHIFVRTFAQHTVIGCVTIFYIISPYFTSLQ